MSSGFITESEVVEARKKRQEEWEKVRKADDPLEVPEQPYDSRSLYERLQEQKQRKELEYEEAHKLKNMIKGLDDDEIEFLDLVDRTKLAADRRKNIEEEKELNDYRQRVANLQEKSLENKLQLEINLNKPKAISGRSSQVKLLKGIIVTKNESTKRQSSTEDPSITKKVKLANDENDTKVVRDKKIEKCSESRKRKFEDENVNGTDKNVNTNTGLMCIGILPGLGHYEESSSDDCSSNSDQDSPIQTTRLDLLGRKILKKDKET